MRGKPATLRALVADAKRARSELGWTPRFHELETIIGHAWVWERKVVGRRPQSAADHAYTISGSTDSLIPTAFKTAKRVFSVGFPLGDRAR